MCSWQEQIPRLQISELAQANVLICQEESGHKGFTPRMLQFSMCWQILPLVVGKCFVEAEWVCSVLKFKVVFVSIARYSVGI